MKPPVQHSNSSMTAPEPRTGTRPLPAYCAAIVAVGTEVCAGDIANTNGAWLANELTKAGLRVTLHLVVEDDRTDIAHALDQAAKAASQVFVIGGLGPTTDDFTREVISSWTGRPLVFQHESWQRILSRFERLGRSTPPSNKQQCYFPQESEVFANANGTADAFTCQTSSGKIWALPGPPRELKGIWNDHFSPLLKNVVPASARRQLRTWQCLGQGESLLAEITEQCLSGSDLERGYRARFPYVDIKVWVPEQSQNDAKHWLSRLGESLKPWLVGIDHFDLAEDFAMHLVGKSGVRIVDHVTAGSFFARVFPALTRCNVFVESLCYTPHPFNESDLVSSTPAETNWDPGIDAVFTLHGLTADGDWFISAEARNGKTFSGKFQTHLRSPEWSNRNQVYIAEQSLHKWSLWLKSISQ